MRRRRVRNNIKHRRAVAGDIIIHGHRNNTVGGGKFMSAVSNQSYHKFGIKGELTIQGL